MIAKSASSCLLQRLFGSNELEAFFSLNYVFFPSKERYLGLLVSSY